MRFAFATVKTLQYYFLNEKDERKTRHGENSLRDQVSGMPLIKVNKQNDRYVME